VSLADSLRALCSSHVRRVRGRVRFRSGFVLGFRCSWFADGLSFSRGRSDPAQTVRLAFADGPFFRFVSGGSVVFNGLSAAPGRTVRGTFADCPRHLAGLSAWPVRTVRPSWPDCPPEHGSFAPWFDSSLPSFVLPHVLQGIVPKT
jgi:hypothetical protein